MKILILGGCGYTGSILTNNLLKKNYFIEIIDNQWFGCHLQDHENLKIHKMDILDISSFNLNGFDVIINLANIANDPTVELNQNLSWEVNVLSTYLLADKAYRSGVKQIIYASSGSVYGLKKEMEVTEDLTLEPISIYNKTKMIAERVLMSFSDKIKIHCIRPATVCGYSPRLRLDVAVNNLTYQALSKKNIIVLGGNQVRPNIHIQDLSRVYEFFLENSKIDSGFFNAGFENISIIDLAKKIQKKINSKIEIKKSNDPRSYRQSSKKLLNLGFVQKYNIDYGIEELMKKYSENKIQESSNNYNVKKMIELNLGK